MMKKVFEGKICENLKYNMDNMIFKSREEKLHNNHLTNVFNHVRKYNMRLNLEKCTFVGIVDKFLGFYLTPRGIKASF